MNGKSKLSSQNSSELSVMCKKRNYFYRRANTLRNNCNVCGLNRQKAEKYKSATILSFHIVCGRIEIRSMNFLTLNFLCTCLKVTVHIFHFYGKSSSSNNSFIIYWQFHCVNVNQAQTLLWLNQTKHKSHILTKLTPDPARAQNDEPFKPFKCWK